MSGTVSRISRAARPRPGVSLIGIVLVDSIVPSNTKVSSIENYVTVTLRLTTQPGA